MIWLLTSLLRGAADLIEYMPGTTYFVLGIIFVILVLHWLDWVFGN